MPEAKYIARIEYQELLKELQKVAKFYAAGIFDDKKKTSAGQPEVAPNKLIEERLEALEKWAEAVYRYNAKNPFKP